VKSILPELVDAFEGEHIYKFLHLPVQSGDDEILKAMGRNYCIKDFTDTVDNFRNRFDDLYLATDIIVGFPGEGEEEFLHTCELIEKTKPDKVNLTRFSPMPGTVAAKLPQVEGREVKRRSRLLSEKCRNIGFEVNKHFINRTAEALVVEEGKKGGYTGRLPNYKPVIVGEGLGEFIKVRITDAHPTYLLGEVAEPLRT
jgi:tRNA A37 methylthiotransferase MiaB